MNEKNHLSQDLSDAYYIVFQALCTEVWGANNKQDGYGPWASWIWNLVGKKEKLTSHKIKLIHAVRAETWRWKTSAGGEIYTVHLKIETPHQSGTQLSHFSRMQREPRKKASRLPTAEICPKDHVPYSPECLSHTPAFAIPPGWPASLWPPAHFVHTSNRTPSIARWNHQLSLHPQDWASQGHHVWLLSHAQGCSDAVHIQASLISGILFIFYIYIFYSTTNVLFMITNISYNIYILL